MNQTDAEDDLFDTTPPQQIFLKRKRGRPASTKKKNYTTKKQAQRIVEKFGGARRLAEALKAVGCSRNPATIYKWLYPRIGTGKGGTGGLIPAGAWPDILKAAAYDGVIITSEDFDPREF